MTLFLPRSDQRPDGISDQTTISSFDMDEPIVQEAQPAGGSSWITREKLSISASFQPRRLPWSLRQSRRSYSSPQHRQITELLHKRRRNTASIPHANTARPCIGTLQYHRSGPEIDRVAPHSILNALPLGICIVDIDGNIVHLNQEGMRILGWSEHTSLGKSLHALLLCHTQPTDRDDDDCPIDAVLRTREPAWVPQMVVQHRNGTPLAIDYKCVPLITNSSMYAMVSFRDLGDQIRLEHDLKRLASMPDENPNPIVELDAEGSLIYSNQAMVQLMGEYGFNEDAMPTILPSHIVHLAKGSIASRCPLQQFHVTDSGRYFEWTFFPIPQIGLLRGYGLDLTEIKETETRLQQLADRLSQANQDLDTANRDLAWQQQQAESASRLKSEFLANTSHELRTPLNSILGFIRLILDGLCDSPEEERQFMENAHNSAKHLLALINDVLDIAKIEAGKMIVEPVNVDLDLLFEEVRILLHVQSEQKHLVLDVTPPQREHNQVYADPDKLKQVLINLLGNAIKFTDAGSVTLSAQPASTSSLTEITVKDTGIGIPTDRQTNVTEAFVQADGATTRKYGGTGLGLSISKRLMEMMGGSLELTSEGVGHGTTVTLTVPIEQPHAD